MAESRILLDTNAYFRLGQSIHPLLNTPFGDNNYNLYVLKELQLEYVKNPRLTNQFEWVGRAEYVSNRSVRLSITAVQKREIDRAYEFILNYARTVQPGVSKTDVLCLAYGEQLQIPVVTDDGDMRLVGKFYGIKTLKTIEMLKIMLDCGHIDMEKVQEIVSYWAYMKDTPSPKTFKADCKRLFGKELP